MKCLMVAPLFLLVFFWGCAKPKDLVFVDVQNLRMLSWGFTESEIGLDLRLFNPNNQRVQMKEAAASIYANMTFLGKARMDSLLSVPRKDTFSIPLRLNVKTMSALTNMLEAFSDSTILIQVDGTVKMGKGGIFLTYPIKYQQLQKMSDLNF